MAIERILLATDFSPQARHALDHAAELSRRLEIPLLILTVVELPVYPLPEGAIMPNAENLTALLQQAGDDLDAHGALARGLGAVGVETLVSEGPAAAEISKVATERGVGMVVVGSHGRPTIVRAIIGSVADRVARTAPCPVLVVRQDA